MCSVVDVIELLAVVSEGRIVGEASKAIEGVSLGFDLTSLLFFPRQLSGTNLALELESIMNYAFF